MSPWEHGLQAACKVLGIHAGVTPQGLLTIECPCCPERIPLDTEWEAATCPKCPYEAHGEPWEVAAKLKADTAAPAVATDDILPLWTLDDLMAYEPDPTDEIWERGALTAGLPAVLVGAPGVGKTRLSLQAAICTVLGKPFLGWETRGRGKRWLFLQTENNGSRLKHDLQRMTALLTVAERKLVNECIRILNIDVMEFGSICMVDGHPDRVRIETTLASYDPAVVVIDPMRDAGTGDPNKDDVMTETCRAIGQVVKYAAPKRVPLVIQHGRTGKAEGSRVFGDDAASFARNSKVMYGWVRSQINVASAGVAHPGIIIVGCGKCSDGRPWEPFAARLNESTMTYIRLSKAEFDVEEWAEEASAAPSKRSEKPSNKTVNTEQVITVVAKHGGTMRGGEKAPEGLVQSLMREYGITRDEALRAADEALGKGLQYLNEPTGKQGHPVKIYTLGKS